MSYQPDYEVQLAERAAAIATALAGEGVKLGNEGYCAHFNEIAQLAMSSFMPFPLDFDWDAHVASGGDCWDIEMAALAGQKAAESGRAYS